MDLKIFGGNRMGSYNDFKLVPLFHEMNKMIDAGAGRVPHEKTRGEVNDRDAVLRHLFSGIFNIPPRASPATREAGDFHLHVLIDGESAFPVPEGPEAFSSRAVPVTITDDDADSQRFFHNFSSVKVSARSSSAIAIYLEHMEI